MMRFETCRVCGLRWNVSALNPVQEAEYVCPVCRRRDRDEARDVLGRRLKRCRADRGLSGQTVAELCGLSRDAVYEFERGRRNPRAEELAALANFYRVSVDWLLGRG